MSSKTYRSLTSSEIAQLQQMGNYAEDWSAIEVSGTVNANLIRNNTFLGKVSIGVIEPLTIHDGDLPLPEGIYNSVICNSSIGDHCAIHNLHMLSGYAIGNHCLLFNVNEMTASAPSLDVDYSWLSPMNENEGRRILPFNGMTIADAYLWAKYRDHPSMVTKLEQMTRRYLATAEGCYGNVGDCCVIKNTLTIHNVAIRSDAKTPTRIEDCIVLSDGVVGYGCKCEYGCIAKSFVLGENVHLEFGVRLNDTVVGDNSTIARCEVGNSLIFPAHEQHHNNSFLIASLVMGQSNMAAGCTVGSNHNGRTADNEIVAGRGFWPGLCTSLKHSSSFASYCLLAKGSYPAELSITLPFALVNNNTSKNRLEVMPAYWWMYNMYALNRNITKFAKRDKRDKKAQHIVFTPFAPDTAEEIVNARMLLKYWTEQAYLKFGKDKDHVEVLAYGMEKGKRPVVVLKAAQGYKAYEEMLIYYAMLTLLDSNAQEDRTLPSPTLGEGERVREWVNLGGQLVPQHSVDELIRQIETGEVDSWEAVHECFNKWWNDYELQSKVHAYHILCDLCQCRSIDAALWQNLLQRFDTIKAYVADQVRITRQKDADNLFRQMTYRNDAEMKAVLE